MQNTPLRPTEQEMGESSAKVTKEKETEKVETVISDQQVAKEQQEEEQPPEEEEHLEEVQQQEKPQQVEIEEEEKPTKEEPAKDFRQKEPVDVPSASSSKRKLSFVIDPESKRGKISTSPISDIVVDLSKMSTRQLKQLTKRKQDMVLTSVKNILYNFALDADIDEEEPLIDQLEILAEATR